MAIMGDLNETMAAAAVSIAPLNVSLSDYNASRDENDTEVTQSDRRLDLVMQPYSIAHLLATSILLGTMILATIIGNVFVIAAIVLERNLQNVANYLIASLAVADLMVAALVMPLAAVNEVSKQWFMGSEMCDMWISFDVLCCTSSILHLVAIAIDRYWAVTRLDYIQNRSARQILLMIALSWVISVCISIPPLFGWKDNANDPDESGLCIISQDHGYTIFSTVGAFYLPLLFMIIIYIKIFRAARFRIRKRKFRKQYAQGVPRTVVSTPDGTTCNLSVINNSPEHSSNGSAVPLNDANRNNKTALTSTPPPSPALQPRNNEQNHRSSFLDLTKMYFEKKSNGHSPRKREQKAREKVEHKRERKAARTLAIITGTFVGCWLPFFIVAIVRPFCGSKCHYPELLMSIIGWLGYFNSLLNPMIYTIFNPDFRSAFRKILFGKYRGQHMRRR